jgi:hypothetical protein
LYLRVRISPDSVFIPRCGPAPVSCLRQYRELRTAGLAGIRIVFGLSFIDLRFLIRGLIRNRCRLPSLGLNYRYQLFP